MLMDLDDVTLELRTREQVHVALSEFPLLESDKDRVRATRRLIRHAGKEIGTRVKTVYAKHADVVAGMVDRQHSEEDIRQLLEDAARPLDFDAPPELERRPDPFDM
jgi:hypothetical protein